MGWISEKWLELGPTVHIMLEISPPQKVTTSIMTILVLLLDTALEEYPDIKCCWFGHSTLLKSNIEPTNVEKMGSGKGVSNQKLQFMVPGCLPISGPTVVICVWFSWKTLHADSCKWEEQSKLSHANIPSDMDSRPNFILFPVLIGDPIPSPPRDEEMQSESTLN